MVRESVSRKGGESMATLPKKGIDISEFNGDVDLAALKGQVEFVIIRCGYGGDYPNQDDTRFEENVKKAEAAGIPWGTYLYSYAKDPGMARSEAAHTLRLLQGKCPQYGVWYDVEDASLPQGEVLVDNVVAYCQAVEQAGYYCGLYSFLYWLQTRLNSPRLDSYDKWVAQWSSQLDYQKPCGMWQFTDKLVLNGKTFDGNWAFLDYPALTGGKEEQDMTQEQVEKIAREQAQKVYEENEKKYRTMDSLPGWAKAPVKQVYRELGLSGTGDEGSRIDAGETYVRALTVIAKVLDKLKGESPAPENKS